MGGRYITCKGRSTKRQIDVKCHTMNILERVVKVKFRKLVILSGYSIEGGIVVLHAEVWSDRKVR